MGVDNEEIECPVCDHMIGPEATVCPGCGTDFTLSGMDELDKVIQDLDRPAEPAEVAPLAVTAGPLEPADEGKKGRLSKWLKRH